MPEKPVINLPASVRQRLLNLSRKEKRDFQEVLTRFALERLLYRLGKTQFADQFILKGALLFVLWTKEIHRFTVDMDLLGRGEPSPERLAEVFRAVCHAEVEPDGLVFDADAVTGTFIREDNIYSGARIVMQATLERARVRIQVDIGFGDAVVPEPVEADFPPLLDFPAPRLRAYRKETSIAEKFLALTTLGMDNSRMKDYFDIWLLSRDFTFDGATLAGAVAATFARQRVPLPGTAPVGLTPAFGENATKRVQWEAFVKQRVVTPDALPPFADLVAHMATFLLPPLEAAARGDAGWTAVWSPGGPWQEDAKRALEELVARSEEMGLYTMEMSASNRAKERGDQERTTDTAQPDGTAEAIVQQPVAQITEPTGDADA